MSTIKTVELIDDIRNDALIMMRKDSSLSYGEAYKKAKENLIGEQNIYEFDFKPFTVELDENLLNNANKEDSNEKLSDEIVISTLQNLEDVEEDFYGKIKKQLKEIIDIDGLNNDQLEQLYIGTKMNIDITKVANKNFSASQIKFLCVMLASGRDVTKYLNDYNFNPEVAFSEIAELELSED